MSGHSKWATIKRKKEVKDKKRGKLFGILVRDITIAARNGRDPAMNPALKVAIANAKKGNLPQTNVDRAIDRGASVKEGKAFEVVYGTLGPNGEAAIIEIITDNKNRTTPEIKGIIEDAGFKYVDGDSIMWNFNKQGYIILESRVSEEDQLDWIDSGAEDFIYDEKDNETRIVVHVKNLEKLKSKIGEEKYKEAGLGFFPKESLADISKDKADQLRANLEDHDDVESVWGNWE